VALVGWPIWAAPGAEGFDTWELDSFTIDNKTMRYEAKLAYSLRIEAAWKLLEGDITPLIDGVKMKAARVHRVNF